MRRRILIGISGASGAPLAVDLLQQLRKQDLEIHGVITRGAEMTLKEECGLEKKDLWQWIDQLYENEDLGAAIASGTFRWEAMVVVPCSMKTLAGIAHGYSDNLLLRAADVTLKERRRLILVPRECPLSPIHLRNLCELAQLGALIVPPMLSYYQHPQCVEECTRHITGKIMDQLGYSAECFQRWRES